MGAEKVTTDVGDAVASGKLSPPKSNNDVSDNKDGEKEGVEERCEDTKDAVKNKTEEVNVDQKDTEVSKDENGELEKEVKDSKEEGEGEMKEEETKSDAMEVDNVDLKDAELSKDDKEEEKEVKDSKEEGDGEKKEEAMSVAMEVDDVANVNGQHDDKIEENADLEAGSKKRATKKSGGEKSINKKAIEEKKKNDEPKTPVGPIIDRPVRERKSVERLVAVIEQDNAKAFHIEKGRGTALKDIPSVANKLSRKKVVDDTLKLLHTVLFVRRGKEKQKIKVHEKLDKLKKEKLFEFCDLLDLPITRNTAKKEDVIAKLIDFLLVPHATTSELPAEKEQSSKGTKRKKVIKKIASTPEAPSSKDSSKKSKNASHEPKDAPESEDSEEEEQEDENNEHQNDNGGPSIFESEEHTSEPESEKENNKKRKRDSKKPPSKMESASKAKSKKEATLKKSNPQKKTPTESSTMLSKSKDQSESQPPTKTFSRKKKNHVVDEKTLTSKKSASKEMTVKKAVKGNETPKEEKLKPSDDELETATCEILKKVDFNKATFTDILKMLNERFNTELTPRKATLKSIIKKELTKLADEDNDETDAEKTGKESSAQKA